MIPSLSERGYGRCSLLRSVPDHLIYSWGSTTCVFRHSSHGERLAAVRVGQQTLQGFDLAPSADPLVACTLRAWSRRTLR
jgi:hypothetical protein